MSARLLILFLCLAASTVSSFGARQGKEITRMFRRWASTPDSTLLRLGVERVRQGDVHEAFVMLSTVVNRSYHDTPSGRDGENVARALNAIGYIYLYEYYDYQQAMAYFQRARRMAERGGMPSVLANVYLNMGNIYATLSEQRPTDKYFAQKTVEHYRKSFDCALRSGHAPSLQVVYCNMLMAAFDHHSLDSIAPERARYHAHKFASGTVLAGYAREMESAVSLVGQGRMKEAMAAAERARRSVDTRDTPERFIYDALLLQLDICERMGDRAEALRKIRQMGQVVSQGGMKDLQVGIYAIQKDFYQKAGEADSVAHYELLYLRAKDELANNSRLMRAGELHFLSELEAANDRVRALTIERRHQRVVILLSSLLVLITIVFAIWLARKNRRLRHQQRALYDRMQEKLRAATAISPQPTAVEEGRKPKYQGSKLTGRMKEEILGSVRQVMSDPAAYCSPDFSLRSLSDRTGYAYADLSQVINELCGKNFSTLLGECRVSEACRRLGDDGGYGRMTIEAVAQSVGFRSRTNFATVFKKVTGLTPSEYIRTARAKAAGEEA